MKPLTFVFTDTTSDESEKVAFEFTEEDTARIRDYVEAANRLVQCSVSRAGFPTRIHIEINIESNEFKVDWICPDRESIEVFLHRYRLVGLKKEPTYFCRIRNIVSRSIESNLLRGELDKVKGIFFGKHINDSLIGVLSNGTKIISEDFLQDWLNSHQYHGDKEKYRKVEGLHQIVPIEVSEAFLILYLSEKLRAISRLAIICGEILDLEIDPLHYETNKQPISLGGAITYALDQVTHETVPAQNKPRRNEPCPCGSGKKYKQCHGMVA